MKKQVVLRIARAQGVNPPELKLASKIELRTTGENAVPIKVIKILQDSLHI
jgi:hypothetical protein